MNKKLTNILRTNVTLYFICLVLFALAAIPFDVRLAIGEGAAAVVLLIIARRRSRSVQQSMRQYMDRFTGGMDSARSSNMLFAPLPMMVFDMDTQAVVSTRRTAAPCGSISSQRHCRWWARSHISGVASRRPVGTMLGTRRGW